MNSGTVSSRDPDAHLTVVRGQQVGRRRRRDIETQNSRPVVVVLGMHRSGTSLLSNLLHYLGVDMADTTDHVSKRNASGFWERPELNRLQDEVLDAIGRPIGSPEHCLPLPPAWWRRKEVQAIKPRIVAFVEDELAKSTNLWGFKDPRTCRLLPLWWEIFRELDLTPIYVHALRAPAESAISMSLKNRLRSISATQGELMWIAYNYDILRYVALDNPTLTVDYEEWFADGALVARRLAEALGVGEDFTDEDLRECVASVVSPALRNHVAGQGEAVSRMPIASLLYEAMLGDQRASTAGSRALKNQMSFIGLLMRSTAPIIDELVPLTQLRETTAQTETRNAERTKALDEEIVILNRKLLGARNEAEALRAAADVAARLEALDARLLDLMNGDVGQRIQQIDKRMREMRNETPGQLDAISAGLAALAENGTVPATLAAIERQLATLATDATLTPRLIGIETRLAGVADDRALSARLDAIEARLAAVAGSDALASGLATLRDALAALPDDATLGARFAALERSVNGVADDDAVKMRLLEIETRLRGMAEDSTVPSRLADIEARLGVVAEGATLSARFDTIEARLGEIADGDALAVRLAAIETQLARAAEGEVLSARFDTIEARLGEVAQGEALAERLAAIDGRLWGLAEREATESRLDGLAMQLATLVDGAAATVHAAGLEEEVGWLRAAETRLAARLASRTRRARAVIAAARRDRAALAAQHRDMDVLIDDGLVTTDRLAVERLRTRRLSLALAARDERIAALEARLAEAPPTGTAREGLLAWPSGGFVATPAEDYGFAGGIDRIDRAGIAGWVRFAQRPDLVPIVELAIDGAFVLAQACVPSGDRHGFTIDWRDVPTEHAGRPATIRVAGIERTIDGPELIVPGGQRHLHQIPANLAAELFGGAPSDAEDYHGWLATHGEDGSLDEARDWLAADDRAWPLISVIVSGDGAAGAAAASIRALKAQIYPYWEALCLDASIDAEALDPRVRAVAAGSPPRAAASGDLVSFVEAGDLIARTALLHLAIAAEATPGFALIYSDEDRIDPLSGVRGAPYMKGDWSDDLALAQDYASRLALVHRDRLPMDAGPFDRAHVQQIVTLAASAAPADVVHLPFVLYHRTVENGRVPAPDRERTILALANRLPARLAGASVDYAGPYGSRLRWPLPDPAPRVSIVVTTRDRLDTLRACIDGLLYRTDYPEIEVLIADNGSVERETHAYLAAMAGDPRVRVVACPGAYNYPGIVNRTVAQASGSVIACVAYDFSVVDPVWLRLMVENALRPDIGVVGAKLLYADGSVQHAGLALGIGIASHLYRRLAADAAVRGDRLRLTQDVGAVSAACMAMRRAVWEEVGGLDERFPVAYHDLDLCLKVREAGYRVLWSADAVAQHLETQSRLRSDAEKRDGSDDAQRHLIERWGARLEHDRYYSPNLADTHADGRLAAPPRVAPPWRTPSPGDAA